MPVTPTEASALAAAVPAAQAAQAATGIPASVTLAQWCQESAWGQDMPPGSNNPFGIKATPGQPYVTARTREFTAGHYVWIMAPFAKYATLEDAFMAHAELLATSPAYAPAMAALPDVTGFCMGLRAYATDPAYCTELMTLIAEEGLAQYDAPQPVQTVTRLLDGSLGVGDPGDVDTQALNEREAEIGT
jgi:flagellum-specific peptidoglycan hydrolase FlgJ